MHIGSISLTRPRVEQSELSTGHGVTERMRVFCNRHRKKPAEKGAGMSILKTRDAGPVARHESIFHFVCNRFAGFQGAVN